MIDLKSREYQVPSVMILISILMLAGALVFMLLVPAPTSAGRVRGRELSRAKLQKEIDQMAAQIKQDNQYIRARQWQGDPEAVTARILKALTMQANQRALKLTAFRPERPTVLEGIVELPFSVHLSGDYTAVRDMVRTFDKENSTIALETVQYASADEKSSAVTSTLNLVAFVAPTATLSAEANAGANH